MTTLPPGYTVTLDPDGDWQWSLNGEVLEDGCPTEQAATEHAAEHWDEQQPQWCDRCGTSSSCPECRGA